MCWVSELSGECRLSVRIVAFLLLNSCGRQRVRMLHTLELFVSCSASLYFGCATHVYVVQRCCNYDVRHVRFQARAYEFLDKVIEFCMTRCCGAFGSFIVCGVQRVCQSYDGQCSRRIRYRRVWSFIIHKRQFVFLCYVAGAYC